MTDNPEFDIYPGLDKEIRDAAEQIVDAPEPIVEPADFTPETAQKPQSPYERAGIDLSQITDVDELAQATKTVSDQQKDYFSLQAHAAEVDFLENTSKAKGHIGKTPLWKQLEQMYKDDKAISGIRKAIDDSPASFQGKVDLHAAVDDFVLKDIYKMLAPEDKPNFFGARNWVQSYTSNSPPVRAELDKIIDKYALRHAIELAKKVNHLTEDTYALGQAYDLLKRYVPDSDLRLEMRAALDMYNLIFVRKRMDEGNSFAAKNWIEGYCSSPEVKDAMRRVIFG